MTSLINISKSNQDKIEKNLNAFNENFGDILTIEKDIYDKRFKIYVVGGMMIHSHEDINYINGWLYGCVQARNRLSNYIK